MWLFSPHLLQNAGQVKRQYGLHVEREEPWENTFNFLIVLQQPLLLFIDWCTSDVREEGGEEGERWRKREREGGRKERDGGKERGRRGKRRKKGGEKWIDEEGGKEGSREVEWMHV